MLRLAARQIPRFPTRSPRPLPERPVAAPAVAAPIAGTWKSTLLAGGLAGIRAAGPRAGFCPNLACVKAQTRQDARSVAQVRDPKLGRRLAPDFVPHRDPMHDRARRPGHRDVRHDGGDVHASLRVRGSANLPQVRGPHLPTPSAGRRPDLLPQQTPVLIPAADRLTPFLGTYPESAMITSPLSGNQSFGRHLTDT